MDETFASGFQNPGREFSPCPFWFLNDRFDRDEVVRQLSDFCEKGVYRVVLHPRMGIPEDMEYLSEEFLEAMTFCVEQAAALGMEVVLYDEGMYPSGSACGQVAEGHPEFASRELYCVEQKDYVPEPLEKILGVYDVGTEGKIPCRRAETDPVSPGDTRYLVVLGFSHGTIRGIHGDQDDGGPRAPASADLLSYASVRRFLDLTHERYWKAMQPWFGSTIIGFFTDEPSLLGRGNAHPGGIAWTEGLEDEFDGPVDYASLFFHTPEAARVREAYDRVLRARFRAAYYGQLSAWCREHGVLLMGHPAASDETDLQALFGVPGQDLVWRWLNPDNALTTVHSLAAKSSADMAKQLGRRRNSNEVLGVCGQPGNPWDFRCRDMLWYLNYLFVRGVNLIIPHAFFYSLRTALQYGERPPDVGPGNLWWPHYREISGYIARMSWLNTDSRNVPQACVLCGNTSMPLEPVQALYEHGVEFNYLNRELLLKNHRIQPGRLTVGDYAYDTVLTEQETDEDREFLESCRGAGIDVYAGPDFYGFLREKKKVVSVFSPENPDLRRSHLICGGYHVFLLMNESDSREIRGAFRSPVPGRLYRLDAFTGEMTPLAEGAQGVPLEIPPCSGAVILADPSQPRDYGEPEAKPVRSLPLDLTCHPGAPTEISRYEGAFFGESGAKYVLRGENVRDLGEVFVNSRYAGALMRDPFTLDLTALVQSGENRLEIQVHPSRANTYGTPVPVGIGPCTLEIS